MTRHVHADVEKTREKSRIIWGALPHWLTGAVTSCCRWLTQLTPGGLAHGDLETPFSRRCPRSHRLGRRFAPSLSESVPKGDGSHCAEHPEGPTGNDSRPLSEQTLRWSNRRSCSDLPEVMGLCATWGVLSPDCPRPGNSEGHRDRPRSRMRPWT